MSKENLVILVYRRTHTGDPNKEGIFGYNDCMRSVRDGVYDAVIGIGGKNPWPRYQGIREKITWIGIGPHWDCPTTQDETRLEGKFNGKLVTFDNFLLLDEDGPLLKGVSTLLYTYMFINGKIPRYAKYFDAEIHNELKEILKMANNAPPSPARDGRATHNSNASKCVTPNNKISPKGGCS